MCAELEESQLGSCALGIAWHGFIIIIFLQRATERNVPCFYPYYQSQMFERKSVLILGASSWGTGIGVGVSWSSSILDAMLWSCLFFKGFGNSKILIHCASVLSSRMYCNDITRSIEIEKHQH